MITRNLLSLALAMMLATACAPLAPDLSASATPAGTDATAGPARQPATPTSTTTPFPTAAEPASATPTSAAATGMQLLAYVSNGQLLVTDVTNGVKGGTTQYTLAGENNPVMDIAWSPSGDFVAFVSSVNGEPHIYYIYARGASTPTDLGPGSTPAWSPDSRSLAYIGGTYPNENIGVTTIENPVPQQLTFEANHAWGRPAFTPDGQGLVVATADRLNMGAQGNTSFTLERLALDGSGTRTTLPRATAVEGARLPHDLRFSPDGTRLAFSTSMHISACASPGAYYVSKADGGDRQELISPSLKATMDPGRELYHVGLSYGWSPASAAIVVSGTVLDCDVTSTTMGQVVGGPQMSVLRLDGSEGTIIPGSFHSLSMDRTGTWIAAAHYKDIQDLNPNVEIYSAQTGDLVLTLGPGNGPQFQP